MHGQSANDRAVMRRKAKEVQKKTMENLYSKVLEELRIEMHQLNAAITFHQIPEVNYGHVGEVDHIIEGVKKLTKFLQGER